MYPVRLLDYLRNMVIVRYMKKKCAFLNVLDFAKEKKKLFCLFENESLVPFIAEWESPSTHLLNPLIFVNQSHNRFEDFAVGNWYEQRAPLQKGGGKSNSYK